LLPLWQWPCCVSFCYVFVYKFLLNLTSILNLTISSQSQSYTEFNDIFCVGKYCQLFTHESNAFLSVMSPIETMHTQMPKNARNDARNSPFPLRHVDLHLTHECLGSPHSSCQTTARLLYALPHNDATKIPIGYNGTPQIHPQTVPSLRRSPPKSNTPIPSPTQSPPQTASGSISRVATAHMCGPTDGTSESSIP